MKTYTKPILMAVAMLSMIGCDKSDADGRFSDNPRSEIGTPQEGSLVTAKQVKWNFDNTNDWLNASQGEQANISQTSVESNTEAEDGKVVKIFTKAGTKERKKLKTKKQYGAGLYTWRAYISDLGTTERVSIGSWLWNSDKHELDFEVGSGTAKDRDALGVADDEVIAYITSQDNPALHQKIKIKQNAGHTFQIDLKLAGGKYFATWLIDDVKCAAQQLTYGQEHPFYIFCSTENLKFVGDSWPYKDNYGLWDYVTYTPYSYSMEPTEPQNQLNPPDPEPEPDTGEVKKWTFNSFPDDWLKWGIAKVDSGKLVLGVDSGNTIAKVQYKLGMKMGYGKYTWSVRFPDVSTIPAGTQFQSGANLYYYAEDEKGKVTERLFLMMARIGSEEDRTRLGAKPNQLLLYIQGAEPAVDEYVGLLDANKDYKLTIDLKKVNNKYTIVYSIDGNVLKTLVANYGEDEFKFFFIAEAAANRPWMKWAKLDKALTKHLETKFNFIEYTAY